MEYQGFFRWGFPSKIVTKSGGIPYSLVKIVINIPTPRKEMNMLHIIPWEVWFEDHLYFLFMGDLQVPAVDLQGNIVPENRPKPKRKRVSVPTINFEV